MANQETQENQESSSLLKIVFMVLLLLNIAVAVLLLFFYVPPSKISVEAPPVEPLPVEMPDTTEEVEQPKARPDTWEFSVMLEGEEEKEQWTLFEGNEFSLYYNADTLDIAPYEGGALFIVPASDTPSVWMSVSLIEDPGTTAQSLAEQNLSKSSRSQLSEVTLGKYPAQLVYTAWGNNWNSTVNNQYFIDRPGGGCARIVMCYYLEASEGWLIRLNAMANTFEFAEQ